ncbi:hypothetical protein ACNKHR_18605 [Shigella flexneri]
MLPRQGLGQRCRERNESYLVSKRVKNKAFDDVMAGESVAPASCDVDIANHTRLASSLALAVLRQLC